MIPPRVVFSLGLALILSLGSFALAGDAFVKGGVIARPDRCMGICEKLRASFGADYTHWEHIFWGFEGQAGYYRADENSFEKIHFVPLNVFANLKYKKAEGMFRPFGGGGAGLMTIISYRVHTNHSKWTKRLGLHAVGGFEFGSERHLAFVGEVQVVKPVTGDDPKETEVHLYGGIRW